MKKILGQKISSVLAIIIIIAVAAAVATGILVYGYFWHPGEPQPGSQSEQLVAKDETAGWNTYKTFGIEFKYPEKFDTDYASLNLQISVAKQGDSKIDSQGCYATTGPSDASFKPEILTINNAQFCLTTGGDVGAGQLYTSYYYTTLKNGNYYTIEYAVHTSNGCGAYENSPDANAPGNERYKACLDFEKNYNDIVLKPIQESISTFKFTD